MVVTRAHGGSYKGIRMVVGTRAHGDSYKGTWW